MGAKHAPAADRFWRHVEKSDGCWLWTGSLDTSGYGQLRDDDGRLIHAHRFSFRLHGGILTPKQHICHSCDILWSDLTYRRCVRPDHIWDGTPKANTQDSISKGRFPFAALNPKWRQTLQRGETHPKARLTDDMVRQIRLDYAPASSAPGQHPTSLRGLARKYGVAKGVIQGVVEGKTWRHVT